jgi:hypothetical protein
MGDVVMGSWLFFFWAIIPTQILDCCDVLQHHRVWAIPARMDWVFARKDERCGEGASSLVCAIQSCLFNHRQNQLSKQTAFPPKHPEWK